MKSKSLFTIVLIFVSLYTFAQPISEPFKKANTILIETKLPSEIVFKKWGRHLVLNGYSLDKSDKDFLVLTTNPKAASSYNTEFILSSTIDDNGVIIIKIAHAISSMANHPRFSSDAYSDWQYVERKKDLRNIVYRDVMETISSFGDFNVFYERQ